MFARAQRQQKENNEVLYKPALLTPSTLPTGIPNCAILSMFQDQSEDASAEQPNKTGLPDAMKTRFEQMAGLPLDDVRVHRNSDKPAELGALAYAQGNEIHLGSGQEEYLEHELGHVVQQKQGCVTSTRDMGNFHINDNSKLERAADRGSFDKCCCEQHSEPTSPVIQMELGEVGKAFKDSAFGEKNYFGTYAIVFPIVLSIIDNPSSSIAQYLSEHAKSFIDKIKSFTCEVLCGEEKMNELIKDYDSLDETVKKYVESRTMGNCGEMAGFLYGKSTSPKEGPAKGDTKVEPTKDGSSCLAITSIKKMIF